MELGARECGYCEYVAPAPKATEMSAEQKQHMLQLKEILNKEYRRFKFASNSFAERRLAEQRDSSWKSKFKPDFGMHKLKDKPHSYLGDQYLKFHGLRGCVYWENSEFKQSDGIENVFLRGGIVTNDVSGCVSTPWFRPLFLLASIFLGNRTKEEGKLQDDLMTLQLGSRAADFPSPEDYCTYRMNQLRKDQAFWQGGDDVLIQ